MRPAEDGIVIGRKHTAKGPSRRDRPAIAWPPVDAPGDARPGGLAQPKGGAISIQPGGGDDRQEDSTVSFPRTLCLHPGHG